MTAAMTYEKVGGMCSCTKPYLLVYSTSLKKEAGFEVS